MPRRSDLHLVLLVLLGLGPSAHAASFRQASRAVPGRLLHTLIGAGTRLVNRMPFASATRAGITRTRDIPYVEHDGVAQKLDVYEPAGPGPHPVVMHVHGGGFTGLSKETHHVLALQFAKAGYVVVHVDYRTKQAFPAAHEDVFDAYAWVVANAARYGGDTSRLVLAGESAGANLVTAVTIAATHRLDDPAARRIFDLGVVPKVVLPACGHLAVDSPDDIAQQKHNPLVAMRLIDIHDALLGDSHASERALARPVVFLEQAAATGTVADRPLPPVYAFAGTHDPVYADTMRLDVALGALGVPHRVDSFPGQSHAFHAMLWKRDAQTAWRRMLDFTAAALKQPAAE